MRKSMKCFHFNAEKREDVGEDVVASRTSKLSWARSFSVASNSHDTRRSEFESESREFSDSVNFYEFLSQRRTNDLRVFSFEELKSATRGFSRALVIGEGGFGCVYQGAITDSQDDCNGITDSNIDVAIKQLNRNGFQGHKEWINEVNCLGVVSHPNLVKLVGYCADDNERGMQRLLVYELMRNKSLESHLLSRVASPPLPWTTRLKIAQDAARGLAYLHEEMDFQLIFRDFKTSNILLDDDFNAKLSDFGLARQGPTAGLSHVLTSVVGTVGYAAPEYVQTGRLTSKSDVWSFGVVLFELITGRRAVERNLPKSEQKLLEWVRPFSSDSKKFYQIIDPRLEGNYCIKSALKVASLANKCLAKHPKSRPKMSEVVEILGDILNQIAIADEDEDEEEEEEGGKPMSTRKKVFFLREMMRLRNKPMGMLDWRSRTPRPVRT